ncbi:MAG: hypothetical protein A2033_07510 [Bacteroidetes bacterium GWA2_31_9]|nr:MAG: hypothetical protein A2033_07510 [Bacteroidetes bacterium GWA2_31_9]
MTDFNPPIEIRDIEELIAIANSSVEYWQQEAIDKAKKELKKRGITKEQQQEILDKFANEEKQFEIEYQKQLESNATEKYSFIIMIYIFFIAPLILLGRWSVDYSLIELHKENYKIKFKQRLLLLLGGLSFYIVFFAIGINNYEKKHQAEIDNADISSWEKNRILDTNIATTNLSDTLEK